MNTSFAALGLRPELLEALTQIGYEEMTPIQAHALPPLLEGVDVIGQAMTGGGKTAAFGLALLQSLDVERYAPQAMVLCPTRELADQVAAELRRLCQRLANVRLVVLCGGRPPRDQVLALQHGAQIIVGTPGRVSDHLRRGTLSVRDLGFLVLDEADRMLDMGFIDEVRAILAECPAERQTSLFSATFPNEIQRLSDTIQIRPRFIEVATQVEPTQLRQLVYTAEPGQRHPLVAKLLAEHRPESALLFCETRSDCDVLASYLTKRGAPALALHGQMEQRDRDDVLVQFANGSARLLVATNVAARGLDIPALPMVIITELSPDPESHLHRIGRTGRAGEAGLAISVVATPAEQHRLERIEAFLEQRIEPGPPLTAGPGLSFLAAPNRTLLLLAGRRDKVRKGDVLGALVKEGGLPMESVRRIDLMDQSCAVAIDREWAEQALDYLRRGGRIKKMQVRAMLLGSWQ